MIKCPYGRCTMVNLCKGEHCVRMALELDGWVKDKDGRLVKTPIARQGEAG
jgi:hypothetical protein